MIEVNEYVRTKDGVIDKVIIEYNGKCNNPNCDRKHLSCKSNYYNEEDIVKHSKQLIDLIEVGDYVNGHLIVKIRIDPFNNKKQLFTEHWDYNWQGDGTLLVLYDEDIKNILTHEQYLENCFEVMQE